MGAGSADADPRLLANVERFAAFKTYAVQQALRAKLTDEAGAIRPFAEFRTEALAVSQRYNVDYLQTEYDTTVAGAQMASRWADFGEGALLRYDTAGDGHVSDECAPLDGKVLPKDDPFWDEQYPPRHFNCRCTVVEVDEETAPTPAAELRGLPAPMDEFRANVGKTGTVFGPDHPYFDVPKGVAHKIDQQL